MTGSRTLLLSIEDALTMLGRELRHTLRFPLALVGGVVVPVVMLLLFDYVLGGPIGSGLGGAGRGRPYIDFLLPGILVMTAAAGCSTTAINVCLEMTGGMVDRLRAMPISRSALLFGHVAGNLVRTIASITMLIGVGLLIGFRPHANVMDWLLVLALVAAFAFALAWLAVALGLLARTVAGANGSTLPITFLLPFLSSTFVPANSMPVGVRWFSENQPFTPLVESLRALLAGSPAGGSPVMSLAWCAAIGLVGYLAAWAAFRRATVRS